MEMFLLSMKTSFVVPLPFLIQCSSFRLVVNRKKDPRLSTPYHWIVMQPVNNGRHTGSISIVLSKCIFSTLVPTLSSQLGQQSSYSQQPEAPTQESWIDLLAVAVKFEVNAAVHDAKEALRMGGPFELPATQMLNLGRLYLFDDWISDATLKITSTPMPSVPTREYRLLGDETLALLIELQFKLLQHRANLVAAFPGQLKNHAFSCRQEKSCRSAWLSVCSCFNRLLLHPSQRYQSFSFSPW